MSEANETTETELEPMPPIKRGDVLYSAVHGMLIIELGDGRAVFIRSDGTLVDKGAKSPVLIGEPVHVMSDSRSLLAALVEAVRQEVEGGRSAA